jgi:glycerol-3-phosphate dehydrogenase
VITVTGGKLTTYRAMAEDTVDVAVKALKRGGKTKTKRLKLIGAEGVGEPSGHLQSRFGNEAAEIDALINADASLGEPLVPGLDYVKAEAVWSARNEMVHTLADVLARRTRALLLARDATMDAAESVARLIAPALGWSDDEAATQVRAFKEMVNK